MALCYRGHVYQPNTGCYSCKAEDKREERQREKRAEIKYQEYLNSDEYAEKCHKQQIAKQKAKEDFIIFINNIYLIVSSIIIFIIKIPIFIRYFYNKPFDVLNDFKQYTKIIYNKIKYFIIELCKFIIKLSFLILGFVIFVELHHKLFS